MASLGLNLARRFVHPARRSPPHSPQRIVMIKIGALGDVVMTTPLIRAVRHAWPQAEITYVVGRWSSDALKNNPHIDHLEIIDDQVFFRRQLIPLWRLARQLRKNSFDLGFILDRHFSAGIFGLASGIAFRVGFDRFGEGFAHTMAVDIAQPKYDGEYYLDLLRALGQTATWGGMELFPSPTDHQTADQRWRESGLSDRPVIGLVVGGGQNPGQSLLRKRWPLDHYRQLIKKLRQVYSGADIALFGGPADRAINDEICWMNQTGVYNLAGGTVLQSAALMSRCRFFITHDSGPMHLAAACNVPVIAIFGPTDPRRLAPPGDHHTVLSRPELPGALCYTLWGNMPANLPDPLPCLAAITPDDIMNIIQQKYAKFLLS